jgi:hypothetical protein
MADLSARIDTDVSPQDLWDAVTDWSSQGEWIPLTTSRALGSEPMGEGSVIHAWTGVGRLGFLDEMVVRQWAPPHHLELEHTGRVVRGSAGFMIEPLGARGSRLVWWERVTPPFGRLGAIGWQVFAPVARAILQRSLRKLAAVASTRAAG